LTAEIELKLAIDPAAVAATAAAVPRHPAVAAIARGRPRKTRLVSTYYDTPDGRLARAGIALRVRRDGEHWRQTVKGPPLAGAGGALYARGEYEWPLPGPRLDPRLLATTPWKQRLERAVASGRLGPRFTTDFERRTLQLAFPDGTHAELCIDVGEVRAPRRPPGRRRAAVARAPIAEIEIELKTGHPARLFELARALAASLPLAVGTANKAERGHALAHGEPDGWRQPVRARDVALDPGMPVAAALAALAVECLDQVATNAPGLLHDDDAEWVHQMRVGTRRLRSCLALGRDHFPAAALQLLRAELKWLAGTLGAARDWDVFATETIPAAAEAFAAHRASASDLARLRARVGTHHRAARADARAAVRSPRFAQLLLAAGALCAEASQPGGPAGTPDDTDDATSIADFARRLLNRRHRRLLREAKVALHGDALQRHALRIAAKKLRYAAEFFAPLFERGQARSYASALAGVQDVLGHANDAATAARLIGELAPAGDSPATAALRGAAAAATTAIDRDLAGAWEDFSRAQRFWRTP
jgi:inorganic triphosphatase YgiF